jgi:predicted RNA-binding Zn ribbon-like protein
MMPPPVDPVLHAIERDGFKFRSGRLALDLGATLAFRPRPTPVDLLAAPADVGRWLVAAGLMTKAPRVTGRELEEARALREALYRVALATVRDLSSAPADRALINAWAARPAPAPQLIAEGASIGWVQGSVRGCLSAIARDGVELVGGPLRERLRKCAACSILFVDLSRGGTRRWCSMSACGNRAKVAEFRRRQRESVKQSEGESS